MTLVQAYQTLGVDPATAEREAVSRRYRELVKRLHPDVRPASEHAVATADLQKVNEAFAAVRASGFPAIAPVPPQAAYGGQPPPQGGYRGGTPPQGGYRGGPPPQGAYRGNPPWPPPYGAASRGPWGPQPYGGPGARNGPAAQQGFATAGARAAEPNLGLARRYLLFDNIMARTGGWYGVLVFFALVHSSLGGFPPILPLMLSCAVWIFSTRQRRLCWEMIQTLQSGAVPHLTREINAELSRASSYAVAAYIMAIAVVLMVIFI